MQPTLSNYLLRNGSYIGGNWHNSDNSFAVINPADGQQLHQVADAGVEQVQDAIAAASDAFTRWSTQPAAKRSEILYAWYQLLISHTKELALLLTAEQGKPLAEAETEIQYGASYLQWFAEQAKRMDGDTIPAPSADKRIIVQRQAVGVVAAITPWNFPNAMMMRKVAAALAAGCTFVVKPAQLTPLSALAMAVLAEEAGIPKGVFNVVVGTDAKALGTVLTSDPRVAKFSFTGSTAVGKVLAAQCAQDVKRVTMELGGNAPFIVFDDADLDAAVQGLLVAKFRNAGQTCVCANRVLVHQAVYSRFTEKLITAVQQLQVGSGLVAGSDLGPLISKEALAKVETLVKEAVDEGAKVELGGQRHSAGAQFYLPTILSQVTADMQISQQEIFGPVIALQTFTDETQAIALANDTEYGLAAYFYSRDVGRVFRVSQALQFGMVGINDGAISNAAAPFGGIKQSGYGREGSKYGLDDYTDIKYLCLGGLA